MLALTQEEKQVIVFVALLAICGLGISFLSKRFAPVRAIACVNENLGRININTADKETLKLLPGVGEKLAQRIIDRRAQEGAFTDCEQLRLIKGLRNSTMEKLKDRIFIR